MPDLAGYDRMMTDLMARYSIPGGSLAVTEGGRLVFARGYGFADQDSQVPVQPTSLFRIASLSKLITAAAIMHLVEQGLLNLDEPALPMLPDWPDCAARMVDGRLGYVTIRQLLQHSGGWNSRIAPDPMFASLDIVRTMNVPRPASTESTIRYMCGQPMQFTPGTGYAYSNFGYAILGRLIERVTGMNYEAYVRTAVLDPMGILRMRQGRTLPEGRFASEVKYYGSEFLPSVFTESGEAVPAQYGGWALETMDSHGGWIASSIDYVKFLNALEGRGGPAFLSPASVAIMTARPSVPDWADSSYWYGFGMFVRPAGDDSNWWHSGSLDGTVAYYVRAQEGWAAVVLFNTRPFAGTLQAGLFGEIDAGLWNARSQVYNWPAGDQFSNYPETMRKMPGFVDPRAPDR